MIDTWQGCYDDGWSGEIVPEAFVHPAKFSRGLIRRIYQHALGEDWLHLGDYVCDPFGGVALGGLDAMRHGLNWIGVELEEKFVSLGNQNIELWMKRYSPHFNGWGTAHILCGDSRQLAQVIGYSDCCVSSPPYAECGAQNQGGQQRGGCKHLIDQKGDCYNPSSPSNLGNMKATPAGLAGAISSPPYAETGLSYDKNGIIENGKPHHRPYMDGGNEYGQSPGQLGSMKSGGFEAAVSSPPFEKSIASDSRVGKASEYTGHKAIEYAPSMGNLGSSDDFWSAARQIVEQVYQVLAPGAHAIWVVKAFVKNKQRVDFPGQWRQLCEACGFVTLHEHHAMLVKELGTQLDLNGDSHTKKIERKSFFRRLAEQKGSPRIDFEVIFCMIKPGEGGNGAVISSPPYAETPISFIPEGAVGDYYRRTGKTGVPQQDIGYGSAPGQLGNMRAGNLEEALK